MLTMALLIGFIGGDKWVHHRCNDLVLETIGNAQAIRLNANPSYVATVGPAVTPNPDYLDKVVSKCG